MPEKEKCSKCGEVLYSPSHIASNPNHAYPGRWTKFDQETYEALKPAARAKYKYWRVYHNMDPTKAIDRLESIARFEGKGVETVYGSMKPFKGN